MAQPIKCTPPLHIPNPPSTYVLPLHRLYLADAPPWESSLALHSTTLSSHVLHCLALPENALPAPPLSLPLLPVPRSAALRCRWDLAGLDSAVEQCVRAGVDAVVPRTIPLPQLRQVLRQLGVQSRYLQPPRSTEPL